jgi:PAS domain S-box-containing protein
MQQAKILIVDDLPEMQIITNKVLSNNEPNYEIKEAYNGKEALEIMASWIPDIVITDWDMPILDGPGLIAEIRNNPKLKDIHVIMLTGMMVGPENLKAAFEAGASDFLRKPYDKTELLARVKSMLLISQSFQKIKAQNEVIDDHSRFINSLIATVPIPLVYYNIEGIILNCNSKFNELFKIDANSLLGTSIYEIFPPEVHLKKMNDELIKAKKTNLEYEINLTNPAGEINYYLIKKSVLYNSLQQPEGIISIMYDITDIKTVHEQMMEEKKRELVSSAIRLIQVNQLNERLIEDLNELQKHTDKAGKEKINEILTKYNISAKDTIWKEFELRFEKVYEDFYNRLKEMHPTITPTEKKLCAFLRLNLSSKDIAALTFQDAKSVDMARYRLRKKLNLQQEDSLVEYLMAI